MTNLNVGDLVKLKSGGPLMTVRALTTARFSSPQDSPKDHVECQWFDEEHNSKVIRFPIAAVEVESAPQSPSQ